MFSPLHQRTILAIKLNVEWKPQDALLRGITLAKERAWGVTHRVFTYCECCVYGSRVISESIIHAGKDFKEQQLYPCLLQLMAGENHCLVGQIDKGIWQEDFESITSLSKYLTSFSGNILLSAHIYS